MAFTKSSGLGFDLSIITGPLTALATTAAGVYGQVATQQAQAKIAEAQAAVAKAQQQAAAAAGMVTGKPIVPGAPTSTNWLLYAGIGGLGLVTAMFILKKKKK